MDFGRRERESMNAISCYCRKTCDVASVHQSVSVCSVVGSSSYRMMLSTPNSTYFFPIISVISQVIRHIKFPCLISVINFVLKSQFQSKKKLKQKNINQTNLFTKLKQKFTRKNPTKKFTKLMMD